MTINLAVVITIVTALHTTLTGKKRTESILTAVQLLWVNLIMDTLAALALATDKPTDVLLNRKPSNRSEPIISPAMFVQTVGQAVYQIILCLTLYFNGRNWFPPAALGDTIPPAGFETSTVVFNTFIFCQLFNEINSRSITNDQNVFLGIFNNRIFIGILLITSALQAIIVQFGNQVFRIDPNGLSAANWGWSILFGSGSLVVGFLLRFIPELDIPIWLLAGKTAVENPPLPEIEAKQIPINVPPATIEEGRAVSKWAIVRQHVHAFQVPARIKNQPIVKPIEETPSDSEVNLLNEQMSSALRFRNYRRDTSTMQMIDPRLLQKAKLDVARRRSNSSPNLNK